jgi:hypothetical protein
MKELNIPFVTYGGYDDPAALLRKCGEEAGQAMSVLVATVRGLLAQRQISK